MQATGVFKSIWQDGLHKVQADDRKQTGPEVSNGGQSSESDEESSFAYRTILDPGAIKL